MKSSATMLALQYLMQKWGGQAPTLKKVREPETPAGSDAYSL